MKQQFLALSAQPGIAGRPWPALTGEAVLEREEHHSQESCPRGGGHDEELLDKSAHGAKTNHPLLILARVWRSTAIR